MQKKENTLCFRGHRSERMPQSKEKLQDWFVTMLVIKVVQPIP